MMQQARRNRILAQIPDLQLRLLAPRLSFVSRKQGEAIELPERAILFPISGVISLLAESGGDRTEVAMVGREGAAGPRALPVRAGLSGVCHGEVQALSLDMPAEEGEPGVLEQALERQRAVLFLQVTQSAVCNQCHLLPQRLARWLLGVEDRVARGGVSATQELLAEILGVRRASAADALRRLRWVGAVESGRGEIAIADRAKLEGQACACYRTVRDGMDRILGPQWRTG